MAHVKDWLSADSVNTWRKAAELVLAYVIEQESGMMDTDMRDAVEAAALSRRTKNGKLQINTCGFASSEAAREWLGEAERKLDLSREQVKAAVVVNLCHVCKRRPPHWRACPHCAGRCAICCTRRKPCCGNRETCTREPVDCGVAP